MDFATDVVREKPCPPIKSLVKRKQLPVRIVLRTASVAVMNAKVIIAVILPYIILVVHVIQLDYATDVMATAKPCPPIRSLVKPKQ